MYNLVVPSAPICVNAAIVEVPPAILTICSSVSNCEFNKVTSSGRIFALLLLPFPC